MTTKIQGDAGGGLSSKPAKSAPTMATANNMNDNKHDVTGGNAGGAKHQSPLGLHPL